MEVLKQIAFSFFEGLLDSVKNISIIFYLDKDMNRKSEEREKKIEKKIISKNDKEKSKWKIEKKSNVITKVLQCCALNGGIFLLSLIFFDFVLLPLLRNVITYFMGESPLWSLIQNTLSWIFDSNVLEQVDAARERVTHANTLLKITIISSTGFIWVVPLFVLSKVINTFWFQDIADAAFNYRKGKPTLLPLSKLLADVVFSLLVQSLFLFQSMTVGMIPYRIGDLLYFLHICLLYSLYSFEYKWYNQGLELHKRLTFIESNWPYFFGFGFPLSLLTCLTKSFIINGCLFSMFFPLFIVSASESSAKQRIDFPLRFFSLVVTLSNSLVSRKLKKPATSLR